MENNGNDNDNGKKYYVYILESSDKASTYVGATIDLDHRLRQHNKDLAGGAHATSIKVAQGHTWRRVCHVEGFPDWSAALQFEWRLKQLSRKLFQIKNAKSDLGSHLHFKPIDRRIQALHQLLALERPTSKAKAYSEWHTPPEIVWEKV
uniref:GIY-YIG domain-containing protein n=1 Tax=viral metagenome TaxID=1070528 RepID=A0A6C0I202_9ZZZZ